MVEEEGMGVEDLSEEAPEPSFGAETRAQERNTVPVDTGRGHTEDVEVGSPFVPTLERLADEARYGGYFRIWLNGVEILEPEDSPETIESGMRIAITAYDKVG
jgi:hypothetical protein